MSPEEAAITSIYLIKWKVTFVSRSGFKEHALGTFKNWKSAHVLRDAYDKACAVLQSELKGISLKEL